MSMYSEDEEVELFSVNYDFNANSTARSEDLSGLLNFRAVAVGRPDSFAEWGARSTADNVKIVGISEGKQPAPQILEVRSSSGAGSVNGFVEPPFGLPSASQFVVDGNSNVVQRVSDFLNNSSKTADFDFCFSPTDNTWKGKCLIGASCLEVDVRVYFKQATNEFVVAALKMRGSEPRSVSFMDFFRGLREHVTGERASKRRKIDPSMFNFVNNVLPSPTVEEFLQGSAPVEKMAFDECLDVRLEAAKMMCDLSTKSATYLEIPQFRTMCLQILEALIQDSCEDVRQHAVMALSAMTDLVSYQDAILSTQSMFLPVLFGAIDNVVNHAEQSWQTVKMRRTSAAIVAVLCNRNAYLAFDQLQRVFEIDVVAWAAELVPTLLDSKTKIHAECIKSLFAQLNHHKQESTNSVERHHNIVVSMA